MEAAADYQRAYYQANKERLAEKKRVRRRREGEDLRAIRPNLQRRLRTCLRCDREFMSQGPHNRMCPRCRGGAVK